MERQASIDDRYTPAEIRRYEAIFGEHFISPGGAATAREFLDLIALPPGASVLDVGCGVGGSAFLMARERGWTVDGLDLAPAVIRSARARVGDLAVRFHEGDVLTWTPPRLAYDLVYSRDVFLHVHDKAALFARLRALGGTLLFTDYVRGATPASPEFAAYVAENGYALTTIAGYRALLEAAGYRVLRAEDLADRFLAILREELARLPAGLEPAEAAYLADRWARKIERAERGEQGWALFLAEPATVGGR